MNHSPTANTSNRQTNWIRRADEDGTCDRNDRNHAKRDVRLIQEFDQSWLLFGGFGVYQGAELDDIHRCRIPHRFGEGPGQHGDRTCMADLERTDAQRRADALASILELAASSAFGAQRQAPVTKAKIDLAIYERWSSPDR